MVNTLRTAPIPASGSWRKNTHTRYKTDRIATKFNFAMDMIMALIKYGRCGFFFFFFFKIIND